MIIDDIKNRLFPEELFEIENKLKKNKKNFRIIVLFKGTEKERVIFVPKKLTKYCQRYILQEVFKDLKPSAVCISYRKGYSIRKNALMHLNSKYFLHLDIKHFFNNMQWGVFCKIVKRNFPDSILGNCLKNTADRNFLRLVLTYKDRIVQGSVTSPFISNLYLYEFDNFVIGEINKNYPEMVYTRYSDDIYLSSTKYIDHTIIDKIDEKLREYGLKLNFSKIKFRKLKSSVNITGLSLKKNRRIVVPTPFKKKLKKNIYQSLNSANVDRNKLIGQLSYLKSIDFSYYKKLCDKYSSSKDLILFFKYKQ